MSDYSKQRAENIRKNEELLATLSLQAVHDDLGIKAAKTNRASSKGAKATNAKPVQPRQPRVKQETETVAPRRISTRLKREHIDPNETPRKKRKREAEEREIKAKEEAERAEARELAEQAKKPRHQDLDLSATGDDLPPIELASLRSTLSSLCETKHPRRIGTGTTSKDKDIKSDDRLAELQSQLKDVAVRSRAKVTQDRVYSMAYHPETSKDIVFFGDKHGQVGIWEPLAPHDDVLDEDGQIVPVDEDSEGGRYWRIQPHWPATSKSSVSCIKVDPIDSHSLITSSYDCTIRQASFTTGLSREVFFLEDTLISSFDLPPTGNELWISDTSGGLSHLDLRLDRGKARRWQVNEKEKIGCVSVNPVTPHFVISASNDRTLKLWDARKLSAIPVQEVLAEGTDEPSSLQGSRAGVSQISEYEEIEGFLASKKGVAALRGEFPHQKSVSSAYWDPSGRRIVSTSYDDTLRVWDLNPSSLVLDAKLKTFAPRSIRNHDCQTGRWLTILKAQWHPSPDVYPHFLIANLNHSLDVIGFTGDVVANLADRNRITATQAVVAPHPTILGRIATGNGSGRSVFWGPLEN